MANYMAGLLTAQYNSEGEQIFDPSTQEGGDEPVTARRTLTGEIRFSVGENSLAAGAPRNLRKVLIVADSLLQFGLDAAPTVTDIVDNGNGTATITFSGSTNFTTGGEIFVNVAPAEKFNTFGSRITDMRTSAPFTVTYTMSARNSPITGAAAANTTAFYPLRRSVLGALGWFEYYFGGALSAQYAMAGGADSGQCLAMLQDALSADTTTEDIIICAGMNDIYARGWDYATAQSSIKALINTAAASGKTVYIATIPPRNSADAAWSSAKQTIHNKINKYIWAYAKTLGLNPIDTWRATNNAVTWVNPAASNPDPTTDFTSASDYAHPISRGAAAFGKLLGEALASRAVEPFVAAHASIANQNNLFTNSSLTGTAGTKTPGSGSIVGNAPDSWTVEITAGTPTVTLSSPARTVAADGDASGNNLQAVFAYSGSGTQIFRLLQSGMHASLTPGSRYRIMVPVDITGAAGMTGMEAIAFGTGTGSGNLNVGGLVGTGVALPGDYSGVMVIPEFEAPASLSSLSIFFRFYFTSGGATIKFGKPTFEMVE